MPFDPPELKTKAHYRCQKVAPDLEKDGFEIHRLEGRTLLFRKGELLDFVLPEDVPEAVCRHLGIRFSKHYVGVYTADEYVCQIGSTPVFFSGSNVGQIPHLYWGKYLLRKAEKTKLDLPKEVSDILTGLRWKSRFPYFGTVWVKREEICGEVLYTLVIEQEED